MASVGARYMCLVGPVILFVNMHVLKVFYEQINEWMEHNRDDQRQLYVHKF